jgi:hypothetical protein
MEKFQSAKHYIFASDFDQTLSFNDSGYVLSELLGIPTREFERKAEGMAKLNLVQQGGELAYLLLHDPEFHDRVRPEHLHEVGKRIRLKENIDFLQRVLDKGIAGYRFEFYVLCFEAGFLGKYTSKRYGTYSNDSSADAYAVYDLNVGYTRTFSSQDFIRSLRIGLSVTNVFDKNYLSNVSINDQGYVKNDPTGSTMLWTIGAPRTIMFTVGLGF